MVHPDPGPDAWECTRHTVELSNGLSLHYVDARRQDSGPGRTLVALHGMGSFGSAWLPAVRHMGSVNRAILPDLRGHGHSSWTTEGYWLRDYAGDVRELVERLDLGDFDLAGHSLGARISMLLSPTLEGARTVTLSDTGPEVSRTGALKAKSIAATGSTARHYRDAAAVATALREEHDDWTQEAIDLRVRELFRENWAGRLVPRGDPEVEHLLGRAGLAEVDAMWQGLSALQRPLLLVRGSRSFLLDDDLSSRMMDAAQDPTYVQLDLTHDMLYVRPDLFGSTVDGFLSAH